MSVGAPLPASANQSIDRSSVDQPDDESYDQDREDDIHSEGVDESAQGDAVYEEDDYPPDSQRNKCSFDQDLGNGYELLSSSNTTKRRTYSGSYLRCPECGIGFGKRSRLEKHMKVHNPLLSCTHCSFKSKSAKMFDLHMFRHKKENPQFECLDCGQKYPTKHTLCCHMIKHGIYLCSRCPKRLSSQEERKVHLKSMHNVRVKAKYNYTEEPCDEDEGEDSLNTCGICSKPCRSRTLLKIHVAQHLNIDPSQLTDQLEVNGLETPPEESDSSTDYNPSKRIKLDMAATHSVDTTSTTANGFAYTCPKLEKLYSGPAASDLRLLIRPASENAQYNCLRCAVPFANSHLLFLHSVTMHGFREFDAKQRKEEGIRQQVEMRRQRNLVQQQMKEMRDDSATTGTSDVIASSTQVSGYKCPICSKFFYKSSMYKKHARTHTKTVRSCPECHFKSRTTQRVLQHQNAKHRHMLKCPRQCLALFSDREKLEEHKVKVHGIPPKETTIQVHSDV